MADTNDDLRNDGAAGVPEDGAFDGDATSGSMPSGVADGGTDALPSGGAHPPQDGGVMGAVGEDGVPASSPDENVNDKGGDIPPEEMGR